VEDDVNVLRQPLHRGEVVAIRRLELDALGEILKIPADHVVAPDDLIVAAYERIRQMASEKARGARYKNFQCSLPGLPKQSSRGQREQDSQFGGFGGPNQWNEVLCRNYRSEV
jgi:hypothetical protein